MERLSCRHSGLWQKLSLYPRQASRSLLRGTLGSALLVGFRALPERLQVTESRICKRSLGDEQDFGLTGGVDIVMHAIRAIGLRYDYIHLLFGFFRCADDEACRQRNIGN